MKILAAACVFAGLLCAQQFKFNLDHLSGKSSDKVELNLDSNMLQLAAAFLDNKDPDEAKVKKLVGGLQGIYIRSFEFNKEGQYSQGDLNQIRDQLKTPEWTRMVGIQSNGDKELMEIWVRNEGGKMSGLAILAADSTSLTVANIVGSIELSSLSELGGHFGLPRLDKTLDKKKK
jgi:hypothetical protein